MQHSVSNPGQKYIYPEIEYSILNDTSNQTAAMQAMVNDAASQKRTIVLPPWEIRVSQIIIPAAGIRMIGSNGGQSAPSSVIRGIANTPIILMSSFQRNVHLEGFMVKGDKTIGGFQHGIQITGPQAGSFDFHNLVVTQCGANGIHTIAGIYSFCLANIISSDNAGQQFFIDAQGSPCVKLLNCYAGTVAQNQYGFWIERGNVHLDSCNSLDGGTSPVSCVRVGNAGVGVALAKLQSCNFEAFSLYGVHADTGSDVILDHCTFVAPGAGAVQPVYLVQPTGKSRIDAATKFITGGATYNNASLLPIKVFSRWIASEAGSDPVAATSYSRFHNSDDNRSEPMMNLSDRAATQSFAADYIEHGSMPGYYGCTNTAVARQLTLLDPQSVEVPDGRRVTIKDESGGSSTHAITIKTVNNRNIDAAATAVITNNYSSITLVKRNGQYWIIGTT